ncbi:hypothetical protein CRP1_gp01 [Roseobacter phage CRP-1]|nr:hypothetical protein CRP1_gp01 [Roseobacter phage CRP-1]
MAKSASAKTNQVGTTLDALVKEGKALGKMWSTLNSVKQSTKATGFDTRLGKLLSTLKAQSAHDSGQIPTHVLRTHGIANIDRRRRAEALWFYENQAECVEFIKSSKKGFTSLTALQAAMRKAAKANTAESSAKADEPTAKAEPSNVGQSDEPKQAQLVEQSETKVSVGPITRTKMVQTILKQCELNGLDLETIVDDLISAIAKQEKSA